MANHLDLTNLILTLQDKERLKDEALRFLFQNGHKRLSDTYDHIHRVANILNQINQSKTK